MDTPVAPWLLTGESLVGLARLPNRHRSSLPHGLAPIPGPTLIVAARYETSHVGPYLEIAVGEPARLGARPGWCMTTMVVDSAESRRGGQRNWGFPKQLGSLVWEADGDDRELRWAERHVVIRGRVGRLALPFLVPIRALQGREDGPVVVPGRLRGRCRLARLELEAPEDDALAPLAGSHRGVHVAGMRFTVRPARHPFGLTSTLRAPLRAPEPALSSSARGD